MIPIPVGTRYTATAGASQWSRFRCSHCRYERNVLAVGFGQGGGFDPLSLDGQGASQRSRSRAVAKAEAACQSSIAVARCPDCHRTDGRARRRVILTSLVLGLGLGLAVAICGPIIFFGGMKLDPARETWVFPVVVTVGLVIATGSSWARIAHRLAPPFFEPEDPESRRFMTRE